MHAPPDVNMDVLCRALAACLASAYRRTVAEQERSDAPAPPAECSLVVPDHEPETAS